MNDEHDNLAAWMKRALETEASQITLAPDVRRKVIAAAQSKHGVSRWAWFADHRLALAGTACLLIAIGVALHASRQDPPHTSEPYMQMASDVRGGRMDRYWRRQSVEIRTRNGEEVFIKVEATWPKQTSVIALNMRREG